MQALRTMIGGRAHDAARPGHDRDRGLAPRLAGALAATIAVCLLCASASVAAPPAAAQATPTSGLKGMWGPAFRNGASLFPTYRALGIGVYEDVLRWNIIARRAPLNSRNPFDPHYVWPREVIRAVAQANRYKM